MISILELVATGHYVQRREERGNIRDIFVHKDITDFYGEEQVKQALKNKIEQTLHKRLTFVQPLREGKSNDFKGIPIYYPTVLFQGKEYPITIKVISTKKLKSGTKKVTELGHLYAITVAGENVTTLLLLNKDRKLYDQVYDHVKRNNQGMDNIKLRIDKEPKSEPIDIDILLKGKTHSLKQAEITPEELPYDVKADYRISNPFTTKDGKKYKIVNTSSGKSGKAGPNGKLDWIEIEDPHVKGGKLVNTRKKKNIYTTSYWTNKK